MAFYIQHQDHDNTIEANVGNCSQRGNDSSTVIQNNESQQEDFKIMAKITKVGKYSKFSIARFLQIPSGALHEEHAHCTLGRRRSKISHSKGGWVNLVHG